MANCCLIFTGFLAIWVAIIVGMYFNRVIPEGMPENQNMGLRVLSVFSDIVEFLVSELKQLAERKHTEQSLIGVML